MSQQYPKTLAEMRRSAGDFLRRIGRLIDEDQNMIYVFHLTDHLEKATLRREILPLHKAYLGKKTEQIAFAGPLVGDDGTTSIGSLLAIDFDSKAEALAWLADEPFTKAGLYANQKIHAFLNLWPQKSGFPLV